MNPLPSRSAGSNDEHQTEPSNHATRQANLDQTVHQLLEALRLRFYAAQPPTDFHRDRRMLLYALTWPAVWLDRRALTCSPARYQSLLADRLEAIALHGDPARYGQYFPAYLLKCLQDWFQHHGDELYTELKHVRNALDQVLASARFAAAVRHEAYTLDLLASAHQLLHAKRTRPATPDDDGQLSLF